MEDKRIEYKEEIPKKTKDLKAEIVSFLNSDGGTILLGVDDNGKLLEEMLYVIKNGKKHYQIG